MENHPTTTYDRPFRILFEDGVQLLLASEDCDDIDVSNTFARGSIACTMMLPEAAANICVESLCLPRTIFAGIDRLSPLGKFDYYLRSRHQRRRLPVGTLPVHKLQELKVLRDRFVHPKRFQVTWEPAEGGIHIGQSKRTQYLDMSSNPAMWFLDDGINAMRGAHEFLSFFFKDLCRMPRRKTTDLLFSEEVSIGEVGSGVFLYGRALHSALKRWKVNASYFRIGIL